MLNREPTEEEFRDAFLVGQKICGTIKHIDPSLRLIIVQVIIVQIMFDVGYMASRVVLDTLIETLTESRAKLTDEGLEGQTLQ